MKRLALLAFFAVSAFGQTPFTTVLTWATPSDIRTPAPLTAVQLNAVTPVVGTYVYTPALDTVLSPGANQTLSVTFTPTDTAGFTSATATVQINVLGLWDPYPAPSPVTVCQMDTSVTPPVAVVDSSTSLPRCFVVPTNVATSMTKVLLNQTTGLDSGGHVTYKYASFWDYVVKFFIGQMVMPALDAYPTSDLAAAKAAAANAAAAVDAAKAAILVQQ